MPDDIEMQLQAAIQSIADNHVQAARQWFGMAFDYSPESLRLVDEAISMFHAGDVMDSTVEAYGAYIGETIRRTHGGTWRREGNEPPTFCGIGQMDCTIFPFNWAAKRLREGEGESIAFKYAALLQSLGQNG